MTTIPDAALPVPVEDDPARPWKALAALIAPALIAFLQSILDLGADDLPRWAWLLIASAVTGLAVFITSNPKRVKGTKQRVKTPKRV